MEYGLKSNIEFGALAPGAFCVMQGDGLIRLVTKRRGGAEAALRDAKEGDRNRRFGGRGTKASGPDAGARLVVLTAADVATIKVLMAPPDYGHAAPPPVVDRSTGGSDDHFMDLGQHD